MVVERSSIGRLARDPVGRESLRGRQHRLPLSSNYKFLTTLNPKTQPASDGAAGLERRRRQSQKGRHNLRPGISHNLESAVDANRRSLFQNTPNNVRVPETIWGFHTHCGFCPVRVSTRLSDAMASKMGNAATKESHQFQHEPDNSKTLASQLDAILAMPVIAELCALLQAGLLPYSMASEFGEEERKSACNLPLFIRMPPLWNIHYHIPKRSSRYG